MSGPGDKLEEAHGYDVAERAGIKEFMANMDRDEAEFQAVCEAEENASLDRPAASAGTVGGLVLP